MAIIGNGLPCGTHQWTTAYLQGVGDSLPILAIALTRSQSILFDHLVGEREQLRRNVEAERLGGLKIDRQLELG